jgi:hypothetical protein
MYLYTYMIGQRYGYIYIHFLLINLTYVYIFTIGRNSNGEYANKYAARGLIMNCANAVRLQVIIHGMYKCLYINMYVYTYMNIQ